ncbi:glycosyltransferase [Sulfurimonas sp.]|uniref:glycosyltransferase n=1 Tax=Sulfurimonas sp. TaxID=2022749 RepID=UPI00356824B1
MIKIILYTENYFPGGLERFIFDFLKFNLFDVHIIINSENNRIIDFAKKNNLTYSVVKLYSFEYTKLKSNNIIKIFNFITYYFSILVNYFILKKILNNLREYNNLMIVNGGYPGALSSFSIAIAARRMGFEKIGMSILSSTTPLYSNKIFSFIQSKIDFFTDKYIDFYMPNSNKIKLELVQNAKIRSKKINVIYTGVNVPKNINKINMLKCHNILIKKDNNIWITMVGLLGSTKRQDLLLDAMTKLDSNINLLLVGDGPSRIMLEKKAKLLNIDKRVVFIGWMEDIAQVYQFSDLLVFLSDQEGLPYVISEAMSYKVPVIASCIGGIPEQIENSKGGLLVSNDNIDEIVKQINYLIENQITQENFTDYSFNKLKNLFSIEVMNNKIFTLYK